MSVTDWVGPCVHGRDPWWRCDNCETAGEVTAMHAALLHVEGQLQAAKDRASTSYREGYEAGKAAGFDLGAKAEAEARRLVTRNDAEARSVVLASNPLDPKAANIWEVVDMLASLTASMRGLVDALALASSGEAARLLGHWQEVAERRRAEWWTAVGEADKLREQIRLLTKERDEWREEAMALRKG